MHLELQDINPVILTLHLGTGPAGLQARHGSVDLANHGDGVLARCADSVLSYEVVAPEGWQLSAGHEDEEGLQITWQPTPRGVMHELSEPTTDPLEVTLTASNAAGETKKKKVYLSAKPGGALPDRP